MIHSPCKNSLQMGPSIKLGEISVILLFIDDLEVWGMRDPRVKKVSFV